MNVTSVALNLLVQRGVESVVLPQPLALAIKVHKVWLQADAPRNILTAPYVLFLPCSRTWAR
jgi:hypothetical protein